MKRDKIKTNASDKAQNTFGQRFLTGAVLVVCALLILSVSGRPYVVETVSALLGAGCILELLHAASPKKMPYMTPLAVLAALLMPYVPLQGAFLYVLLALYAIGLIGSILLMLQPQKIALSEAMPISLCCLWTMLLWRCIPAVRASENGLFWLCAAILATAGNDVFAYLIGSAFGTHPLCTKISPHKTVEGLLGGLGGTILLAASVFVSLRSFVAFPVGMGGVVTFALCCSLIGNLGDLFFSACKRILGVKDFGSILPGHGGLLDRFDSLLYAAPLTLLWITLPH